MTVLHRSLGTSNIKGLRVLDAVVWPGLFGQDFRLYLRDGTDLSALQPGPGVRFAKPIQIGGGGILHGTATGAMSIRSQDTDLAFFGTEPEPDLLAGRTVLLGQRHQETPEQVSNWIKYHVEAHGINGVLLLNRSAEWFDLPQLPCPVVLITGPMPLGHVDKPAVGSRALAPRSKDRQFTSDPWRAPLAEPLVFDALRWRFLTQAEAVLVLDPCDFLTPTENCTRITDEITSSHTGFLPMQGRGIFPWRLRKTETVQMLDHVCHAHPPVKTANRWAVDPKRLGAGHIWLPHSVTGATAMEGEGLTYDRAMSVLFPNVAVPELVNKDLLELDPMLLHRAEAKGHSPVLPPPRAKDRDENPQKPPSGRTVIVTCMKNEGPFILEWLAYHRMIGVDDFLVYTNDCDDGTDHLLDLLAARGLVERRDNPFRATGGKPQQSALDAARSEDLIRNAGWIISMDVDEFINVHVGKHRLQDLFDAVPDANVISLTWRLFGNADVIAFEDRPVTQQFTRCAPQLIRRPHQAWGFKTLFSNQGLFKGIGVHRPRGYLGGSVHWVNGSGKPMPERMLKTGWRSEMDTFGYDLVTLNHYSVRSVESFLVKRDRGRVNHVARDQGEGYWFRMNNNDEQDLSIQVHMRALDQEIAQLKADPEIAAAHQACVAAHRAKIKTLRENPEFAGLYDRLCSDRFTKLSRMHRHFGMNVFLSGPAVIPDRVFDPDLPRNFFFNTAPPKGKAAE